MDSEQLAELAADACDDRKAVDIRLIRVDEVSSLADWMVIAGGQSDVQVRAIAQSVEDRLEIDAARLPLRKEGLNEGCFAAALGHVIYFFCGFGFFGSDWAVCGDLPVRICHAAFSGHHQTFAGAVGWNSHHRLWIICLAYGGPDVARFLHATTWFGVKFGFCSGGGSGDGHHAHSLCQFAV